jgi:hypothetical protein
MDRFMRYAAYLANLCMIVGAVGLFANAYGREKFIALLLAIPAILSLMALWNYPDLEERRLARQVSKARLRRELLDLEAKK